LSPFILYTMRLVLLPLAAFVMMTIPTFAQDHYDPAKTLSSEELFLKKTSTNRIISQPGQKYLVLDASPWLGGFHRYRFFPGDNMRFRMKNETIRFNETIASIADSSFTIGVINEAASRMDYQSILLKEVRLLKVQRNIPFVTQAAPLLPLAGLIFIAADFFNKGTDNKRFTTDGSALAVGGAFMAGGFVCYKMSFSSLKINSKNKLKVLETY
jgi:hypothetical protein